MKSEYQWKNNRGFSLMEVIIAVAIISIVLTTITGFMVTGTKLFHRSSSEIEMQEKAQLAVNNIENRIIDAQLGAAFDVKDNYHILTILNESDKEYIFWVDGTDASDANKNKVFYDTSTISETKTKGSLALTEVLADKVENFSVTMSEAAGGVPKANVQLDLQDKRTGRKANSQKTISFRNNIATNVSSQDQLYVDTGIRRQVDAKDVKVSPDSDYVIAPREGSNPNYYTFSSRVTGTGHPSQMVTWSLQGEVPTGVEIDANTGKLTISPGAKGSVTVVATSSENSNAKGTAVLNIVGLDSITVTSEKSVIYAGTMLQVKAHVSGAEGADLPESIKKVNFSVVGNTPGIQLYSDSGLFGLGAEARGKTYTVRATSAYDSSVYGDYTFKVEDTSLTDGGGGSATVDRGGSVELITNLVGENLAESELNIVWSIADDAGLGSRISINSSSGVFTASKDINYENEYVVEVKARITAGRLSTAVEKLMQVTIPKVALYFEGEDGTVELKKNNSVTLPLKATGLVLSSSDISVATNPALSNCIVYPTNKGVQVSIGSDNKTTEFNVIATLKNTNTSASQRIRIK